MTPLPFPDDSWFVRPQGLPERASVGAVVLRWGEAGWRIAVVVEPGEYRQLPKGGLEGGETREEAGLEAVRLVSDLGTLKRQNYARTRWQVTRSFLGVTDEEGATPLESGFRLEWHPLDACPPLFWPEQARLVPEQARLVGRVRQGLERGEYGLT